MSTISQDSKTSSSLSQDSRTANAAMTQDNKTIGGGLWSSTILPWTLDFPWLWQNDGSVLTLDTRH